MEIFVSILLVLATAALVGAAISSSRATNRIVGISEEQTKIMQEQTKIADNQTSIMAEQRDISARQATISEKQTNIMEDQKDISAKQTEISTQTLDLNKSVLKRNQEFRLSEICVKAEGEIRQKRAEIQAESDSFYSERHSQEEIQEFEDKKKAKVLDLDRYELSLMVIRKHLELVGARIAEDLAEEYAEEFSSKGLEKEFLREVLSRGFSEELWEEMTSKRRSRESTDA